MAIAVIFISAGFIMLIKGADWLVTGATSLARKYNVSDLVIGLTIVSFGTSAPELVVNSIASFQKHSDLIFGNVIGSNNFNLFVILGITGLILPVTVKSGTVWKEIPVSLIAALVLLFFSNNLFWQDEYLLTRFEGGMLLAMFGFFLYYVYRQMKTDVARAEIPLNNLQDHRSNLKISALIIAGLAALVAGGKIVVTNASEIALLLGVSEKVIGLTILAAGTSLPELVTSLVAVIKKSNDIAIGNVIGSNIFNIFFILAVSALINPVEYNPSFNIDIYMLSGGTLFLFISMFMGRKEKRLDRLEAAILLGAFIIYTVYLVGKEI